jgi:omega-amidase
VNRSSLTITMMQIDIIKDDVSSQLSKLESSILPLKGKTDCVVFPETFNTGFPFNASPSPETMDGKTVRWMKEIASETGAALCGSILISESDMIFNRFLFVDPDNGIITYDKRHLFSYGGESEFASQGSHRVIIPYRGWNILPIICYDLRFPVWIRNTITNSTPEYDCVICVASWPSSRKSAWNILIRARAVENQAYVCGVNRVGKDDSLKFDGGSAVISPEGFALCECADKPDISTVVLDYESLQQYRNKFPVLPDADTFNLAN